ncbi:MAG: FHA domain-containing protein [Propionibacteriaceae bacterium]|nr:FHA domain-containing protein [Propionibacteriaceae bacterium]
MTITADQLSGPVLPPGFQPVTRGARAGARILDTVLSALGGLGAAWASNEWLLLQTLTPLGIAAVVLFVGWAGLSLWAILGRGARLGGLLLGQRWVRLPSGERSGGRLLGKLLAQSALGLVTLGIGEPIISFATFRADDHRTAFDRWLDLFLVAPARQQPAPPPRPPAPSPSGSQQPGSITQVGVRHTNAEFIESLPWRGDQVAQPVNAPTPARRPAVVRRRPPTRPPPPRQAPAAPHGGAAQTPGAAGSVEDHTVFAPHAEGAQNVRPLWLWLDDGQRVELTGTVVFGRAPATPSDLQNVTLRALPDPSMRMSKTHLAIGIDPAGVWIQDLHSSNGVRVTHPGGAATTLSPGESTPSPVGSRIEFGGRWVEVCDG